MEKVSSGQKFSTALKADTWNAFIDAAQYVKDRRLDQNGYGENRLDDAIDAHNASGFAIPQYGVVWLKKGPVPTNELHAEFMVAKRPTCPFLSQIGIAAEPILDGRMGKVWISGIHPVLVSNESIGLGTWESPLYGITQTDSFKLATSPSANLSWGVPLWAQADVDGHMMARLPLVPPPMVRVYLYPDQMLQIYGDTPGSGYRPIFHAAFLSFPDADLSDIDSTSGALSGLNYGGLSVE